MQKTSSLVRKLSKAFPQFSFKLADDFRWSADKQTICYVNNGEEALLLHELAHALLGHDGYKRDIDLVAMERDAWSCANSQLANQFGIKISPDLVEDSLDSYREWLHARSKCPSCDQTGIQIDGAGYRCLGCDNEWRTNDSRHCGLRRYALSKNKTPAL